jgi:hypothetical protein
LKNRKIESIEKLLGVKEKAMKDGKLAFINFVDRAKNCIKEREEVIEQQNVLINKNNSNSRIKKITHSTLSPKCNHGTPYTNINRQ